MKRILRLIRLWLSLSRDPKTPVAAKVFPWAALLYLLLPVDFVPDFIPILGQLDDISIIIVLVTIALKVIPKDLWQQHEAKSKRPNVIDV